MIHANMSGLKRAPIILLNSDIHYRSDMKHNVIFDVADCSLSDIDVIMLVGVCIVNVYTTIPRQHVIHV